MCALVNRLDRSRALKVRFNLMETQMASKKHGNKEAKKPKQAKPLGSPEAKAGVAEAVVANASDRMKKKK